MGTRFNWRDDATSFEVDMSEALASDGGGGLDLDATTPIRGFDVRAAFAADEDNWDRTVANPDHPLINAEREIFNREQARQSSPPARMPVLAPMPSIYAVAPAPRPVASAPRPVASASQPVASASQPVVSAPPSSPRSAPPSRYSTPSTPTGAFPESTGSLAPTALEVPQSYFSSYVPTPSGGVKAPPLSIVSSTPRPQTGSTMLVAAPARRTMTGPKIAVMCGVLALAAAIVAFTAASSVENAGAASRMANAASAPQSETTALPIRVQNTSSPRSTALPAEVTNLLAPADPASDWRARLTQGQGAVADTKAQR